MTYVVGLYKSGEVLCTSRTRNVRFIKYRKIYGVSADENGLSFCLPCGGCLFLAGALRTARGPARPHLALGGGRRPPQATASFLPPSHQFFAWPLNWLRTPGEKIKTELAVRRAYSNPEAEVSLSYLGPAVVSHYTWSKSEVLKVPL